MATKVYGSSDDLIEFEGDVDGEVCQYGTDDGNQGNLCIFSDNTILEIKYGKMQRGIWEIKVRQNGSLFDRLEECNEDEGENYSDIAYFKDGLKWAYSAKEWSIVK